ncbi:hypothetical protein ACIRPT_18550 [Streptomyces sp. NPDC101227]|uniref:hypothetical protein n=1 Tax=Streptomyces sp. NPDC101227 TaxID=3366136 RepID=UPI0038158AEB
MNEGWYRLLSVLTAFLGFWQGPMAIFYRLTRDDTGDPMRAANYLDNPWCYIIAAAVIAVCLTLLAVLDKGRKKALAREGKAAGESGGRPVSAR